MEPESLTSQFSSLATKVEFINIEDHYNYNDDLICHYKFINYKPVEGDRVAIYKSGWSYVKDYFLFEWSPITGQNYVTFKQHCLPKDDREFYQFCYISVENEVLGASVPFQFTKKPSLIYSQISIGTNKSSDSMSIIDSNMSSNYEKEMQKLREENEVLKESLKLFVAQRAPRNYDRDINELKTMIYTLKDVVNKQRSEIDFLKNQVRVCLECNRNLIKEKSDIERKYRNSTCNSGNSHIESTIKCLQNFELGELESMPPFPLSK